MARSTVPITGAVLRWAIDESGYSDAEVADRLKVEPQVVAAWKAETSAPSRGQFSKLAEFLRRPSALFFLAAPPAGGEIPTQLRSAPGLHSHELNPREREQIRWARRLQANVAWVRLNEGHDGVTLGRYSLRDSPSSAAAEVRSELAVDANAQRAFRNNYAAWRAWRGVLEQRGYLVFQLELRKGGIRGFSLGNDHAPLIAVNSAYHITNRIFTLFHELGHLITGTDSACYGWGGPEDQIDVERWCERFAASILLPPDAVRAFIAPSREVDVDSARRLGTRFRVSTRAAAIRLEELRIAPSGFYDLVAASLDEAADWNVQSEGGLGETTAEKRLRQFGAAAEVLLDARELGQLSERDVARALDMSDEQIRDLGSLLVTEERP